MGKLKTIVKKALKKAVPNTIRHEIISDYNRTIGKDNLSFSQEGEDRVLMRLLSEKQSGFYVDVGAHHPFRFSNTYLFYLKGWRGINIDAMPGSMKAFEEFRPEDINLELGVSEKKDVLTYHVFNEPALNTFSSPEAQKKDGLRDYKIINKIQIETLPLSQILQRYLPKGKTITFLSIDVEGLDLQVLKSNDWVIYKPEYVLVESLRSSLEELKNDEIFIFLHGKGYELIAKTFNTLFFKTKCQR